MKQEIIQQLRSELFQNRWCISDFEKFDVPAISKTREPFIICIAEDCTHLVHCGARAISSIFESESDRMDIYRDKCCGIQSILYYADRNTATKIFYYNGLSLQRIDFNEVRELWGNLMNDSYEKARDRHPYEAAFADQPLEITFGSDGVQAAYYETLEEAKKLGDDSLANCVKRLQNWRRETVNHKILITRDFVNKSFTFTELVNDRPGVCGGIVYNGQVEKNRWSIHT